MSKDIVVLKKNKLKKFNFEGNYIFESDSEYYLFNRFCSSIFHIDNNYKLTEDDYKILESEFENYILKICEFSKLSETKPSFAFFNKITSVEKIKNNLGEEFENITDENEIKKLSEKPSFYYEENNENIENIIEKIVQTRTGDIPTNNVFIVLNKPEEYKLKHLMHIVTVSRSRNIYFLIFNYDRKKFEETYDEFEVETIFINCRNYFVCDNEKIFEFRYYTYGDKSKFKSQKFKNKKLKCVIKDIEKIGKLVCLKFKNTDNE